MLVSGPVAAPDARQLSRACPTGRCGDRRFLVYGVHRHHRLRRIRDRIHRATLALKAGELHRKDAMAQYFVERNVAHPDDGGDLEKRLRKIRAAWSDPAARR